MKIIYPNLDILIKGVMAGITLKICVATFLFPLWSLPKLKSLVKISENNMKDIIGTYIASWRVHLRWRT